MQWYIENIQNDLDVILNIFKVALLNGNIYVQPSNCTTFDTITWRYITMWKLFVLDKNPW